VVCCSQLVVENDTKCCNALYLADAQALRGKNSRTKIAELK